MIGRAGQAVTVPQATRRTRSRSASRGSAAPAPLKVGWRAKRPGIERVHRCDVGRAGQQHVDLDEIAKRHAGLVLHALDAFDRESRPRLGASDYKSSRARDIWFSNESR